MRTQNKSKLIKHRASTGCKVNLANRANYRNGDDTIVKANWVHKSPNAHYRLVGFNKQNVAVVNLGNVGKKGSEWLATLVDGTEQTFNKRPDAMSWVRNHSRTSNPGLWSRIKGAVTEFKQKRTAKKVHKRLREAEAKNPKKRRNPESEALDLFESFHGVPSKEVIEFTTQFHVHEHLAGLGRLIELVFFTPGSKPQRVTLEEEDLGDGLWLCASEDGKQLYILGQVDVDLEALGYRPEVDVKDAIELGRLTNVVYKTQKQMNQLKMLDYDHRLGKRESWQKREGHGPDMNKKIAECPVLAFHPLEHRLTIIGGQYLILPEGISN